MRIFKERQRFNQLWIIILIIIGLLAPIGIILGVYLKNPESFTTLEITAILCITILAPSIIFIFKLTTRIDEIGIHYKFFPFHFRFKTISWNQINKAYVRRYDALSEYGGWGLKGGSLWKKSNGTSINVSGNIGIQLELTNGKKILIGTQKKNDATNILATYKSKIKIEEDV